VFRRGRFGGPLRTKDFFGGRTRSFPPNIRPEVPAANPVLWHVGFAHLSCPFDTVQAPQTFKSPTCGFFLLWCPFHMTFLFPLRVTLSRLMLATSARRNARPVRTNSEMTFSSACSLWVISIPTCPVDLAAEDGFFPHEQRWVGGRQTLRRFHDLVKKNKSVGAEKPRRVNSYR